MKSDLELVNHLLLQAKDSSEALLNLNRLQKSLSDKWSLQFVCTKLGIPSTGYFSDVLKGKRRLHPKYTAAVRKTYKLSGPQHKYFEMLLHIDQLSDKSEISAARKQLSELASHMQTQVIAVPKGLSESLLFHIHVLSSFSLFPQPPTLAELEDFFGRAQSIPLAKSLHRLIEIGLVQKIDDRYSLTNTRIVFSESEDGFSHIEFLEKSIQYASRQAKIWFPMPSQSMFLSTVVTVNKQEFEAKLPEINSRIYKILEEMNRSEGDQLVEFNIQLFPFDPRAFHSA